jgi:glycosyltransferase involved in cell wall biosynthesis
MALPHLVHDGENGYLFEPGSVEDARAKLERVLGLTRAEREALGKRSLEMVQAHDIDTTMELFERLYRGESVKTVGRDSANEQDHSLDDRPAK